MSDIRTRLMRALSRVARNAIARRELSEQEAVAEVGKLGLVLVESWHRVDPVAAERAAAELDRAVVLAEALRLET